MTRSIAAIGPTIMSVTGLTETAIGTSWIVPAGTKSIDGVKISVACGTVHDAVLSAIPRLRIYSKDLKIEPCEILGEPPGSSPVTSGNSACQWESEYYPLNIPCSGGETVYFYGTDYVTMTTAPWMGVDVYFSTGGPSGPHYYYRAADNVYATTVTAGAAHRNPTKMDVKGGSKITAAFGVVWQTTSTAAVGCIGYFSLDSTDFNAPYGIYWNQQGGGGILSAGDLAVHVSKAGYANPAKGPQLDMSIKSITNITETWTNGPTNIVGAYVTGVQFI